MNKKKIKTIAQVEARLAKIEPEIEMLEQNIRNWYNRDFKEDEIRHAWLIKERKALFKWREFLRTPEML